MNNNKILSAILKLIFLIVFNIIFFMFGGTNRETSVWISYGFILLSYLMLIITQNVIRPSNSSVLGLSLYSISSVYFLVEFIVGVFFIVRKQDTYKIPLAIQLVIFSLYLLIFISTLMANNNTIDSVQNYEEEVAYIKGVSSKVKLLIGQVEDKNINKRIEHIYDLLHTSPSKSNNSVKPFEKNIILLIDDLEGAVQRNDTNMIYSLSSEIENNVKERNRLLKNN